MSEFLGARISLISRSDIRYVGILHEINSDESTVSLENVKSFGTEGRKGKPEEEVAPSEQLYEYIVFRGTDVKDLRIEEGPGPVKENKPPAMPNDPAILGARPRPSKPPGAPGGPTTGHAGVPPGALGGPPGPPGPPGMPNYGYYPPHLGGWGRANGPGSNGFGGMPYPPPPGWFPPGQEFSHMGLGPWNNYAFPPGGPPVPPGMPAPHLRQAMNSQAPSNQTPSSQPPAQSAGPKQVPIGPGMEKTITSPAQQEGPAAIKPTNPASSKAAAPVAPAPPVDSKPSVAEVQATAASLANKTGNAIDRPVPAGATKAARTGQILPAVPLPTALTSKSTQPTAGTSSSNQAPKDANASALRDATQAAKAAVALAMAKLENPQLIQQAANDSAMDNLSKKVNEMRVNAARTGTVNRGERTDRGGRGRGPRPAKVEVPDADFDFASANAKFNKQGLVREAVSGSPLAETPNGQSASVTPEATVESASATAPAYNKASSFFDNISSDARERAENNGQKPGGRVWRGEEQRKNMETFGQSSVDGGHPGYRGRGRGRGGRGRGGYNRGGRGGGGMRRDARPVSQ